MIKGKFIKENEFELRLESNDDPLNHKFMIRLLQAIKDNKVRVIKSLNFYVYKIIIDEKYYYECYHEGAVLESYPDGEYRILNDKEEDIEIY